MTFTFNHEWFKIGLWSFNDLDLWYPMNLRLALTLNYLELDLWTCMTLIYNDLELWAWTALTLTFKDLEFNLNFYDLDLYLYHSLTLNFDLQWPWHLTLNDIFLELDIEWVWLWITYLQINRCTNRWTICWKTLSENSSKQIYIPE